MIYSVAIIGLGMMGGSIAAHIRNRKLAEHIIGYARRRETLQYALDNKLVDSVTDDLATAVENIDLAIVCLPIELIPPTLEQIDMYARKKTIVTDIGSTKAQIVKTIEAMNLRTVHFIGGHPMAGSEKRGVEHYIPTLIQNALYILTPTERTDQTAFDTLESFVQKMTPRVMHLSPDEHDRLVGYASHLPYLAASLVVSLLARKSDPAFQGKIREIVSSGFRDTTRVASSDPKWGESICETNHLPLIDIIGELEQQIKEVKQLILDRDSTGLHNFFDRNAQYRDKLYNS